MKGAPTVSNEDDARIRRAESLRSRHPAASEFLEFYKHVVSFQKRLRANMARANQLKSGGVALAESARQFALLPSESWISSLEAYWQHAGIYDQQVGAFAQFLPRAFLQPYAESRASLLARAPLQTTPRLCPLCGSRPLLGVLRREGDGGRRFLLCSFCLREWAFRRILCPTCGEEAEDKLPVYVAEDTPHVRVEACNTCKFYLRTIDLTRDGNAIPLVDDIAAVAHTLCANEQGYTRLQPNLLGT